MSKTKRVTAAAVELDGGRLLLALQLRIKVQGDFSPVRAEATLTLRASGHGRPDFWGVPFCCRNTAEHLRTAHLELLKNEVEIIWRHVDAVDCKQRSLGDLDAV